MGMFLAGQWAERMSLNGLTLLTNDSLGYIYNLAKESGGMLKATPAGGRADSGAEDRQRTGGDER